MSAPKPLDTSPVSLGRHSYTRNRIPRTHRICGATSRGLPTRLRNRQPPRAFPDLGLSLAAGTAQHSASPRPATNTGAHFAGAVGQPGGDVQQSVPQCFRLARVELGG